MRRSIEATVDARKAFKKLNRAERMIKRSTFTSVKDLADLGKYRAKEIAPHWSGETARMIRAIHRQTSNGSEAQILSPSRKNYSVGKGLSSSIITTKYQGKLVKFLHSPDYEKIAKTGKPYYMYDVGRYLNRIWRRVTKKHFDKITLR